MVSTKVCGTFRSGSNPDRHPRQISVYFNMIFTKLSKKQLFFLFLLFLFIIYRGALFVNVNFLTKYNTVTIKSTTYQETIISSGNIGAVEDVVLKFETDGVVKNINIKEGDSVLAGQVLLTVASDDLESDIRAQQQNIEQEKAKYRQLLNGASYLEAEIIKSTDRLSFQNFVNQVRIAIVGAQFIASSMESIIYTEIDRFFNNIDSKPQININIGLIEKAQINKGRRDIELILNNWKNWRHLVEYTPEEVIFILKTLLKDLYTIDRFLVDVYDELRIKALDNTNFLPSFNKVSEIRTNIFKSIEITTKNLNALEVSFAEHSKTINESREALAGQREEIITQQLAILNKEVEALNKLRNKLNKNQARAPFSGIIGKIYVNKNDKVDKNEKSIRIISKGGYQVSMNVTETDVYNIYPEQQLKIYVEAVDKEINGIVRTINQTETIIDGVPVYNVVLDIKSNIKLRSGFTADVIIPAAVSRDVLAISPFAIINNKGKSFIRYGSKNNIIEVIVGVEVDEKLVEIKGVIDILKNGEKVFVSLKEKTMVNE